MRAKTKNNGFTLVEIMVVVAIIVLFAGLSLPGIRALVGSFEIQGGTRTMIAAALSSARAIAAKEQRCAGVRFQYAYNADNPDDVLGTSQYMIFIIHDETKTGLTDGYRAVEGIEPIKLPDSAGVMDLRINDTQINSNGDINSADELRDTTTFSIIFSPNGRIVMRPVWVRNRDGEPKPTNLNSSRDDIFNSEVNIRVNNTGMFVHDDWPLDGLKEETSRNRFIIFDKNELAKVMIGRRWSGYLESLSLAPVYINPYTGSMISKPVGLEKQ